MRETADFDLEDFENPRRSDAKAFARFHLLPIVDEAKSAEAGRPIYNDVEFVEIIVPGNQTNRPVLKVTSIERQRFARQYKAWKESGSSEYLEGTPLTEVPWITRSQVEELAYSRVRTLEQLASVDDLACQRMMGLLDLRRKAQAALTRAEASAPFTKLQEQLDKLAAENASLKLSVEAQAEKIKSLEE